MRKWLAVLVSAASVVLVLGTVVSAIRTDRPWIRVFDFPRVQFAVLAVALIVAQLLAWRAKGRGPVALLVVTVLAFAYQCRHVYPYTPLAGEEVEETTLGAGAASLRLLTANVLMENRESQAFLDLVREANPDVVLVLEPDEWWERELRPLESTYPHAVKEPLANTYGMILYSKLPLEAPEVQYLVEDDVPSIRTGVLLRSGQEVSLHCIHPRPPRPLRGQDTTPRDKEVLEVARRAKSSALPVVVAGDFNDVAWSRTTRQFRELGGLLDPRIGRGVKPTFPASLPLLRFPLDHVFHTDEFRLVTLERSGGFGSDHLALLVELSYEPDGQGRRRAGADAQ